ncbi:hypothetical protein ACWGOQ_0010500 [Aquimarina sp. M1]
MKLKFLFVVIFNLFLIFSCSKDDDGGTSTPTLNAINLTFPDSGDELVQTTPELTWDAYDSDQPVSYSIYLGPNQDNISLVVSGIESDTPSYTLDIANSLETGTMYYWQVQATIDGEIVAESTVQSFTTELISALMLTDNASYPKRINASVASFNNKLWIIGGEDATDTPLNDIWSSSDGINWVNEGTFSFGTIRGHKLMTFNNKLWLYGGVLDGFISSKIFSSEDGSTWVEESETMPFMQYNNVSMIVFEDKLYRIAGYNADVDPSSEERATYSSVDGINWVLETNNHGFISKYSFRVAAINNTMVAIEPSSNIDDTSITFYSSSDGIIWNNQTTWTTAERGYTSVKPVKLDDTLILVTPPPTNISSFCIFYESDNGIDWNQATLQTTPISARDYDFVELNGTLYAVGGTTITSQTTSADNQVWILN